MLNRCQSRRLPYKKAAQLVKLMQVFGSSSFIKDNILNYIFRRKIKCYLCLPTVFQSDFFFLNCLLRATLPVNQISLLCAGFVFFPPQPGVMQSTTAVATLGEFSCHRRQTTDHFWSWEMLFWAHAPPMMIQIWPKEAPCLFTDPVCCRKSGNPARLGIDERTTLFVR